jgi:DNA-binding NarL/FixJ family response regulator
MEGRLAAMAKLVIVHHQEFVRASIKSLLSSEHDLQVGEAANGREALKLCLGCGLT